MRVHVTFVENGTEKSTTWNFDKFKDGVKFLNVLRKTNKGYFCLWFDVC